MLHRIFPFARMTALGVGALIAGFAALQAPAADAPKAKVAHVIAPDDFFTNSQVVHIKIEIPEAGMAILRRSPRGAFGGQEKRPSVNATVREGDRVYKDVAVHMKGAAGSFREIDDDPALTLHFNKNVTGQTFHGLERLSLNNSVQDRSLLNEQICREMFAEAGVPVPRASHAKVEFNGRDLGVYVLTEAYNKQFLARHFKNSNGNLYDGGFLKEINDDLQKSSGKNPEDRSDLKKLADAASDPNLTNRLERLRRLLDVERFITYLALDVLMCDWDGYGLNRNNYRVYHDPDSDKIVFMPHGLDQMFGVMRAGTDMPLFPRWSGLVARGLMQTEFGRRRYRERLSELMQTVYQPERWTNRVWQLAAQLRPAIGEQGAPAVRAHEGEVAYLCSRMVDRAQFIRERLDAPDRSLKFDATGITHFTDWRSRADFGKPALDEVSDSGRKCLHVAANGSSVGVWSTRLRLQPGKYQLIGKLKSHGVVTDPGDRKGGANLRVAGRRLTDKLIGDSDWKEMVYEFEIQDASSDFGFMAPIQDDMPEVELICELRAAKGEAWFDQSSLRLVRK